MRELAEQLLFLSALSYESRRVIEEFAEAAVKSGASIGLLGFGEKDIPDSQFEDLHQIVLYRTPSVRAHLLLLRRFRICAVRGRDAQSADRRCRVVRVGPL